MAVLLAGAVFQSVGFAVWPEGYRLIVAGFGVFVACGVAGIALWRSDSAWARCLRARESSAVVLFILAVWVALGTLVPVDPEAGAVPRLVDIHHGVPLAGLLGMIAGMQIGAILRRAGWRRGVQGFAMVLAHGGILLILCGAALDVAFGRKGLVFLFEGGQSAVFSEIGGPAHILTGRTGDLPRAVRLDRMETRYYPPRMVLRLYARGVMVRSWPVTPEMQGRIGVMAFRAVAGGAVADPGLVLEVSGYDTMRDPEALAARLTLTPLTPVRLPFGEDLIVMTVIHPAEASRCESQMTSFDPDGTARAHRVAVNAPLRMGFCALYQSDFDPQRPEYSGFLVNCAPGTWVVKCGMAVLVIGLLAGAALRARPSAVREDVV